MGSCPPMLLDLTKEEEPGYVLRTWYYRLSDLPSAIGGFEIGIAFVVIVLHAFYVVTEWTDGGSEDYDAGCTATDDRTNRSTVVIARPQLKTIPTTKR